MSEIVQKTNGRIVRVEGPTRKATIKGFPGEVYYGVHGGIKDFYKVQPREEHPATLDHVIMATGA